jgi:hypothetical protein
MSSFSTGVYIVRLVTDKEVLTGRLLKINGFWILDFGLREAGGENFLG